MVKVSMQIPFTQRRVELNTERLPKLRSLYSKKYPLLTKTTSFAIVALSITGATIAAKRYLDYRGAQASLKRELNLAAKREEARLAEIEAAKRQEARLKKLTGRAGGATLVAGRSSAQRNIATPDGKSLRPRLNSDTAVSDLSGRLDRAGVPVDDVRATFSNLGTPLTGELRGALDGSPENEDLTSIIRRLIEAFGVDAPVQEGKAFSSAVLATQREGADRDGITESMRREPEEAAASRVSRDTSPLRRGGTRAIDLEAQRKEVKKESHSAYTKIAALALLAIGTVAAIMKGTSTIALPKVESIPMGGAVVHYNVPGRGTGVEEFRGPEHSAFSVPLFPTDEGPTDPLIRQMIDDVYGDPALEAGESNSGVRVLPASVVEKYGDSIVNISSAPIDERYVFTVKVPTSGEASKPLQIAAQEHRPDSAADEVVESRELDRASETVPSSAVDEVSQQGGIVDGLVMCAAQDALKRFGLTPAAGFTEEGRARFISPTG
ncbi:MAG: hypothetical protein GWP59_06950 [Chlamydiales bacterium]|nr:hypothetical protein [Chlamydiales bacterium]